MFLSVIVFFLIRTQRKNKILAVYLVFPPYRKAKKGRPGVVVRWGMLSQWLFKKKYLLDRSIGHILDVSVNANSFPVQCSMIASAALIRDRVLHFLARKKKIYSLNFHLIDIKHLF